MSEVWLRYRQDLTAETLIKVAADIHKISSQNALTYTCKLTKVKPSPIYLQCTSFNVSWTNPYMSTTLHVLLAFYIGAFTVQSITQARSRNLRVAAYAPTNLYVTNKLLYELRFFTLCISVRMFNTRIKYNNMFSALAPDGIRRNMASH